MSPCTERSRRHLQRGDILLESLVGVLLTAIIGAGLAHVLAGVMAAQRDTRVEQLTVGHVRNSLQSQGLALCAQAELPLQLPGGMGDAKARVTCQPHTADISFGTDYVATAVDLPPRIVVSVEASALDLGGPALQFDTAFGAGSGDQPE